MYELYRPKYLNYGAMGWVIGHELTHMFGLNKDVIREDRRNCLIDQYNGYFEKSVNLTLNGTLNFEENIADNIGLKMAYNTYKKYIKFAGEELKLPGLDYTPEQLFWISGAHFWCSETGKEKLVTLIKSEYHTVLPWRVFGAFRNMDEFSNDFKCPKNSKMNPAEKCQLWQ